MIIEVSVGEKWESFSVRRVREWPWWAVAPMAVSVMALVWMRRLVAHGKLLMTVERMTGIDFNRDGQVGQPKVQLEGTITDKRGDRNTIWRVTFPGELRHLRRFAAAVNCGSANFSERDAIVCGYTNFEELRDLFILNGWASWRNQRAHQQGAELTTAGESIIEQITRTPLPREREVM